MKVALYARVSTVGKDQDPEVQLLHLRRYVDMKEWEVFKTYTDTCSGKTTNRPGLNKLVKDAQGHNFDAVLVLRIDRIMRSVKNFINLNDTLEFYGVKIISLSDGMDYSTPVGKLVRGVLMQVAEFEVEQLSHRTKEGLEKARADGKKLGRRRVEIKIEKAVELLAEGIPKEKVAKMIGTNTGTLNRRLKELDIKSDTKGLVEN
jgi:DNA invertase Pin-like site-specific DNA recombinase